MTTTNELTPKELLQPYNVTNEDGSTIGDAEIFVLRLDGNGEYNHVLASRKAIHKYADEIERAIPELAEYLRVSYPYNPGLILSEHFLRAGFKETGDTLVPWEYSFNSNNTTGERETVKLLFGCVRKKWGFSVAVKQRTLFYLRCETIDEALDFIMKIDSVNSEMS